MCIKFNFSFTSLYYFMLESTEVTPCGHIFFLTSTFLIIFHLEFERNIMDFFVDCLLCQPIVTCESKANQNLLCFFSLEVVKWRATGIWTLESHRVGRSCHWVIEKTNKRTKRVICGCLAPSTGCLCLLYCLSLKFLFIEPDDKNIKYFGYVDILENNGLEWVKWDSL